MQPQEEELSKIEEMQEGEESEEEQKEEEFQKESKQQSFETSFEQIDTSLLKLKNFDPSEPFIRDCAESIIQSISSLKSSVTSVVTSDFSILDSKSVTIIGKCQQIETKRDIYIEDIVMQKVIHYITIVSKDVKSYFEKLRSKSELESQKKIGDLDEFTLDFDQISEEFLFMILDTLEFFEAYQLCIVVCNRYHLKEKIG